MELRRLKEIKEEQDITFRALQVAIRHQDWSSVVSNAMGMERLAAEEDGIRSGMKLAIEQSIRTAAVASQAAAEVRDTEPPTES